MKGDIDSLWGRHGGVNQRRQSRGRGNMLNDDEIEREVDEDSEESMVQRILERRDNNINFIKMKILSF